MFCSRVPHPYLSCVAAAFALLNLAEGLYILHIAGVTALGLALFALRTALALWFTARPEQGAYGLLCATGRRNVCADFHAVYVVYSGACSHRFNQLLPCNSRHGLRHIICIVQLLATVLLHRMV